MNKMLVQYINPKNMFIDVEKWFNQKELPKSMYRFEMKPLTDIGRTVMNNLLKIKEPVIVIYEKYTLVRLFTTEYPEGHFEGHVSDIWVNEDNE